MFYLGLSGGGVKVSLLEDAKGSCKGVLHPPLVTKLVLEGIVHAGRESLEGDNKGFIVRFLCILES